MPSSRSAIAERVAVLDLAAREPALEPCAPLSGRAVRERLGVHVAGRLALQPVVTNGCRGVEPFLHISLLKETALVRGVSPDAGEAIRLQLEAHRHGIGAARVLALHASRLRVDA